MENFDPVSKKLLQNWFARFSNGDELSPDEAEPFFDALIREEDESLITDILRSWEAKGTTESELFTLASIMRSRCIRVESAHERIVDAVGTGGSRSKTFNVSTAAAFVIAGAGVAVAKHGNRAATSNSGSADVLSELGVNLAVDAESSQRCLNEIGICFMYAPNFHRLSSTLARARKKFGRPTIFNNLGPLCNPAGAPHQLIGVWNKGLVKKTANVLERLGTKRSWVVHGSDGLDELTLSGPTHVAEIADRNVSFFEISPEGIGLSISGISSAKVSSAAESAGIIRAVLSGEQRLPAARDLVLINAGVAIFLAGEAENLKEGVEQARISIKSGKAMEKLLKLVEFTNA